MLSNPPPPSQFKMIDKTPKDKNRTRNVLLSTKYHGEEEGDSRFEIVQIVSNDTKQKVRFGRLRTVLVYQVWIIWEDSFHKSSHNHQPGVYAHRRPEPQPFGAVLREHGVCWP